MNRSSPPYPHYDSIPDLALANVDRADYPSAFEPQMAVNAKRVIGWNHITPALPRFETIPPLG